MKRKSYLTVLLLLLLLCATSHAAEPTTSVRVVRYADDGSVLNETTLTYEWMEANLLVYGDGITHYHHQGPVFEGDKWDPNETANFKDKGAVKGTDVMELCDLVGGMSHGDDVQIHAPDGYHVEFDYTNVYEPQARQGPIVLCWYNGEDTEVGERQGVGHPPDYFTGMRLVFFADDHVFGNWDMRECLPEMSHHFYELYPSTNGLSMKWVDEIRIYSGGYTGSEGGPAKSMPTSELKSSQVPGFGAIFAIAGLLLVTCTLRRRR